MQSTTPAAVVRHVDSVVLLPMAVYSLVFSTQTSMNAWRTMAAVITSAGTQWAPSNAAARKATNCLLMNGHAKVSD